MADVAHDTFGPTSPKPGDLAPLQAGQPDSPDRGKLRVFISYSREDLHFADQLDAALNAFGFECVIDRHGISGGEDWKRRLGNLISETDTVVFVLSPTSARSETCAWEVEEAARLGKRILPVNYRPLENASPPPRLRDLNYVFFHADPKAAPGSGFGTGLAKLVAALNTDFDWLREHTRYLQRATEWDRGCRPANRLLSGNDIAEAKAWAARRPKNAPEPTTLHLDFIRASEEEAEARSSVQRKQFEAMAAAQAERETALHEAEEALKQVADAQRRRARIRNTAFVVVSLVAMLAGWFAWRAMQERMTADDLLSSALNIILKLRDQIDTDTQKEAFAVLQTGADRGDIVSMGMLGLFYGEGIGVAQDYAKAREWLQKAADKGAAPAMVQLGGFYANGFGVPQDYAEAREWFEKAADKGEALAMVELARLYAEGLGVAQNYAKAREWLQKAADKGYAQATDALQNLAINEAAGAGRYAEALQLQEALAAKVEAAETKREGKPGNEAAWALRGVAWYAVFTREFGKALTVSERAHALLPDDLTIETNRAHALMFLGREENAKALYLAHKGKAVSSGQSAAWERVIVEDFAELRKAGLTHPMMADVERELGVPR
jgi:TPR repeat protein